jgi:hypothetical protein
MSHTPPIEHIKMLCAEIGPRGPTTDAEAWAAAYAAAQLEKMGAGGVTVEPFRSVPSLWWAMEIAAVLALVATPLYWASEGRCWAWSFLLCNLSLLMIYSELSFWKLSLSAFLPKRVSQNVHGRIAPPMHPERKVVLIGHLDTHRTPLLFHERLVKYLPFTLALILACIVIKGFACLVGTDGPRHGAAVVVSLICDIPITVGFLIMLHGDRVSPFTEGANDNATGAAIVLSLAEQFAHEPLERTELWALCTGCEEATLTGIRAFLDKHGDELKDACFIDLECLGIGEPRYITFEGMLKRYHSNPGLLRAAVDAAKAVDDPAITGMALPSGYTETAIVVRRGMRGITVMAFPPGAHDVPHWHQTSDRMANLDPQTIDRSERFVAALIRELDSA